MATARQIAANQQNALRSTGPRTARGKAASSRNNTRHGLRASTPVIPYLESPAEWERHRVATVDGLDPATPLERALAERVALILWRLDRVARYERDVTARTQHRAVADLPQHVDPTAPLEITPTQENRDLGAARQRYGEARRCVHTLTSLYSSPPDTRLRSQSAADAIYAIAAQIPDFDADTFSAPDIIPDTLAFDAVSDWTVEHLQQFVAAIAAATEHDAEQLCIHALAEAQQRLNTERSVCRRLTHQLQDLRRERALPHPQNLERVMRYETHLTRQLNQTLSHLRQIQHHRRSDKTAPRLRADTGIPRSGGAPSFVGDDVGEGDVRAAQRPGE